MITEWGVNGPWEAEVTAWDVPIEETSTKKAEQVRERYKSYLEPIKNEGSLGSFIFYWGKKNEYTPSWYSLFGPDRLKTEAIHVMSNIWKNQNTPFPGPQLEYIMLNKKGAKDDIVLTPEETAISEIFFTETMNTEGLEVKWEIRKESWFEFGVSEVIADTGFRMEGNRMSFKTPAIEGPYRLFVYLTNSTDYYATANIPFFVLSTADEK